MGFDFDDSEHASENETVRKLKEELNMAKSDLHDANETIRQLQQALNKKSMQGFDEIVKTPFNLSKDDLFNIQNNQTFIIN